MTSATSVRRYNFGWQPKFLVIWLHCH